METPSNLFGSATKKNQSDIIVSYINGLNIPYALPTESTLAITETFENDLRIAALDPNTRWTKPNNTYFLSTFKADVYLYGVLPLAGLQIMASIPNSELDISLLNYYCDVLLYSQKNSTNFKDKAILNLPDILDSVAFLLEQKEIKEELASLPKVETLGPNATQTTFIQEKFFDLLFLCLESNTMQGRKIFDHYAATIELTPTLLSSVISSYSDEPFQWCYKKWVSENPATPFPQKVLNNVLTQYVSAINTLTPNGIIEPEKVKTTTEAFGRAIKRISSVNQKIRWEKPDNYIWLSGSGQNFFLCNILPLSGLKIMTSFPNSELDLSLLNNCLQVLVCGVVKDKEVLNLSRVLEVVDFLLEQKGIQDQVALLPKEEAVDRNVRRITFTQEKFTQLLLLCRETNLSQGLVIFERYEPNIQVTPELLNLILTQYISAVDALTLDNVIESEKIKTTTEAFERAIKRISSVNQKIRWEKPDNSIRLSDSKQNFFLRNILPLSGLKMMASFPNTEFDPSLLKNSLEALVCGTEKDKKVLNLSSVLDVVDFLLEQKGVQEQLALLPQEETVDSSTRYLTFTREKFTQLLLLCRETNLSQGLAIFERYAPNIQVTPELLNFLIANTSSDAIFQWCAERWIAENPKRHFPKEVKVNMLSATFAIYLYSNNNFYNQQAALQTATEIFKSSLTKIVILNKDTKWDSSIPLTPPTHLCAGEAVFLSNVLQLTALEAMESSSPHAFDASLLMQYYKALDYCRKNSDTLKNKEILNLPDILNAIGFLLKKKEIQAQLKNLQTEESAMAGNHNNMEINVFTQEKFIQLSLLCHELSPEQSSAFFAQCEVKTEATAYLLASLALWSSSVPFEKYAQPLNGNLPDGIVSWLMKKYTAEIDPLKSGSLSYPKDEVAQKIEAAFQCFKLGLSRISAASQQKPLICKRQDVEEDFSSSFNQTTQSLYIHGILPIEAIQFLQEQANIQFKPILFMNYLSKLVRIKEDETHRHKAGQEAQKTINYDLLLETIRFLMQNLDTERVINGFQSTEACLIALLGIHFLQLPQLYQSIYEKFRTINEKKTPTVQKYLIAAILKIANKLKDLELITLFSSHPHASISPKFLKISAELDYYEGLACILKRRPEFWENLPISNKMLKNNPRFEATFQQRLKAEAEKYEDKNTAENHVFSEEALTETFNVLNAIPNIYIPDMMPAIIKIIQFKRLLNDSTQNVIDLEFGSFLSIWEKKEIPHPDPLAVGKNGESLLGSFYEYKPELYTYLLTKLSAMLPLCNQKQSLSLQHKQFCFKLAVLFPNIEELDAYIEQLKLKIDNDNNVWNVISDAANFKIPTQGYWDIEAWFSFVKRNQFSTRHMTFLRAASDMDMKMVLDDAIFCKHRAAALAEDQKSIHEFIVKKLTDKLSTHRGTEGEQARNALWKKLIQQCPLAYEKLLNSHTKEKDKNKLAEKLAQQKDRFKLLLKNIFDLYDLRNPTVTLPTLVALRLRDFPDLSKEYKEAVCIALENGYSNEDIKRLTTYLSENKQAFTFVPSIVVNGAEIEDATGSTYNKCELRLLAKTDPMALVAGLKTRCCQHFNNAGAESAMHAYQSPYGATYVLVAKKNPNDGDWFAQSWTVLSECGTILLFDSIEFSAHAKEPMVLAFFKKAAEKLLENNPHLQEIWVGASQHARLKLAKHGYTSKPVDENFSIAGYSKDSYSDADKIVVLMCRADLKQIQEAVQTQETASVVLHMNSPAFGIIAEETKQKQEETKTGSEYSLRYGVDTYLKKGKVIKLLGLSKEPRRLFNTTYEPVMSLLMEDLENPLLEEGFVSSDPKQTTRYREGECYITYKATILWLENTLNPKLKAMGLAHHIYAAKEEDISSVLQTVQQNTAVGAFTVVAFIGIHAVSVFVDSKNSVCFILDSEPGTDLAKLSQACKNIAPNMRVITPEADLRLQKDFYSCATFALKSVRYFAKNAAAFSKLLTGNPIDTLVTAHMPAALLKMAQTPLELTEEQKQTVVSKRKNLTLLQYNAALALTISSTTFNTAALKTRQNVLKQIHSKMKSGQ